MSSKINVLEIITGHFSTLKSNGKWEVYDFFTFVLLPIFFGAISISLSFNVKPEVSSLLVNFGAIFTALLLSVLVLVYDQETKLNNEGIVGNNKDKKELLRQLYYNISYSILCSVALVLFCLIHSIISGVTSDFTILNSLVTLKYDSYITSPLIILISVNLFLNILMIVKRMHTLLVTD
jgi:hypothetical protein